MKRVKMKWRFNNKYFEVWEHKMIKSNLKSGLRPDIHCFFKNLKAEQAFIFIISTVGIFLKQTKQA